MIIAPLLFGFADKTSKLRLKNKSKHQTQHFFVLFKMWWRKVPSLDPQRNFGKQIGYFVILNTKGYIEITNSSLVAIFRICFYYQYFFLLFDI